MSGAFGGNAQPPQLAGPTAFNLPQAYAGSATGIAGLQGGPFANTTGFLPESQSITQGLIDQSGPQSAFGMDVANLFAPMGVGAAGTALGTGNAFMNAGAGTIPGAQALMQLGFDPNQSVYNRALQQTVDTTGNQLANAGVGTSPYGQSVLANTVGQFNTDWQNQLLQRAATGAGAAGNLLTSGAGVAGAGAGLAAGAPGQAVQSALLPYGVGTQVGGNNLSFLNQLYGSNTAAAAVPQMGIQDWLASIGAGNQSTSIYNQGAEAVANFNAQQQQQQYQNIASAAGGAGSMFGGLFGKGGAFGAGGAFGPGGAFPGVGQGVGNFFSGIPALFA
jgi:hypothetical protein